MNSEPEHKGWIGVDLDQTLAHLAPDHWVDITVIGEPIAPMVALVKELLAAGEDVRVFTARMCPVDGVRDAADCRRAEHAIKMWCLRHIGQKLPVTCIKDFGMKVLYDDRAIQVEHNTGRIITDEPTPCPYCRGPVASSPTPQPHLRCFGECGRAFVQDAEVRKAFDSGVRTARKDAVGMETGQALLDVPLWSIRS